MKYLPIYIVLFFLFSSGHTYAQNFDKYLKKYAKYYAAEKYDKALKTNEKLKVKSIKKLGEENKYLPQVFLNEAELQLREQIIIGIDESLQNSIETSKNINGIESPEHLKILIKSMELYKGMEHWSQVGALANSLISMQSVLADEELMVKLDKALIEANLHQGFYHESLNIISQRLEEFRSKAYNPRGKKDEKEQQMQNYAMLLNFAAENYLLIGEIQKADSVLNSNMEWLSKNLNNKDEASVYQELIFAQLYDARHQYKEAENYYESAYSHAKSGRKNYEIFPLKIHEKLILAYIRYGKSGRIKSELRTYSNLVLENYPEESYLWQVGRYLEMKELLAEREKSEGIEILAVNMKEDSISLPQFHQMKIDAAEVLLDIKLNAKDIKDARTQLDYITEASQYLFGVNSPKSHLSQLQLAKFYVDNTNEIPLAKAIYEHSWGQIVSRNIARGHKDFIAIQNDLADYYQTIDEFEKAAAALDLAAETASIRYGQSSVNYALQIDKIANLKINMGAYQSADKFLQLAMNVFDDTKIKGDNALRYTESLETQARLYTAKGMFDEAEDNFKRIEKIISKVDKSLVNKNESVADLAFINYQLGNYTKAEKLAQEEISRSELSYGQENKNVIPMLELVGEIKLKEGDYAQAETMARQILTLTESIYGKNSSRAIPATLLLAEISRSFGDFEKAQTYLMDSKGILIQKFGKGHIRLAEINSRLGTNMMAQSEDPQKVEALFDEAKSMIVKQLGDQSPLYAEMLKKLAYVKIMQKDYPKAFQYLQEAEVIWVAKAGKRNNINAAEIYVLLGDVYYMLKDYVQAESYYVKSKKLYKKFFSEQHPEFVKVQAKLSRLQLMTGNDEEALELIEEVMDNYGNYIQQFFPALSEREKAKFWNKISDDYEYYNTIILKQIESPDDKKVAKLFDNALNTKAILLSNSMKMRASILSSGDSVLVGKYESWIKSKEYLSESVSKNAQQLGEQQIDIDSLTSAIERLEKDLSLQSDLFSTATKKLQIEWKDIKSAMQKNEVAIEMLRFRYFDQVFTDSIVYAALIIENNKGGDRPKVVVLHNGNELEQKYFKYYKNMIRYRMNDEYSYAKFWKPIEDEIGKNRTIYFSPDGAYSQMNLEAIRTNDDRYILDDSNIILVSNTKDVYLRSVQKKKETSENNALIFGDPEFYVSIDSKPELGHSIIQSLPGTEKEVKKLSELLDEHGWKTNTYVRRDAKEEEVKLIDNPRVFHIATHGFYTSEKSIGRNIDMAEIDGADALKNPLHRSGLMLAGAGNVLSQTNFNYNLESGILTAYEAMNLNLDYTDLVVLSACETGVGDISAGEGVYGLQRAFLVAGAKTLIMSMFKVSDEATNALMVTFYNKWLATGKMRESFVDAKKELRNTYQDPIYWGAFVMLGLE